MGDTFPSSQPVKPCCEKVKETYRSLWKKLHPDKPKPPGDVALFCSECKSRIVWTPDNTKWRNE